MLIIINKTGLQLHLLVGTIVLSTW